MTTITWNESVPSGTSPVGTTPAYCQDLWPAIASGLATEHFWPGAGGASDASAGVLLPGASRAFVAARSASSAPNSQLSGRLFFASDTSRLLLYDSTGTFLAGTPFLSEVSGSATSGYWLRQTGSLYTNVNVDNRASIPITFPIPFVAVPAIRVTPSRTAAAVNPFTVSAATFASAISTIGVASLSDLTIFWEAFGMASSASY